MRKLSRISRRNGRSINRAIDRRYRRHTRTLILTAAIAFFVPKVTKAAVLVWDANAGSGSVQDGSGTWDTALNNWIDDATGLNQLYANGSDVVFGGTATNPSTGGIPGTISLAEPITAGSITFSTGGYTIANNTLTLTGTAAVAVTSLAGQATISSSVAGTDGLAFSGPGTLLLSGANTFTGGVTIDSGVLQLGSVGALNASAPNAVTFAEASTGTLSLNGFNITVSGLDTNSTDAGTATVQNASATGATLTVNNAAGERSVYAGSIDDGAGGGSLGLTKTGNGSLVLSGTGNTFSGDVIVNGGNLVVSNPSQLGTGTSPIAINGLANTGNPGFSGGSFILDGGLSGVTLNRDVSSTGRGPGAANVSGGFISNGNNTLAGNLVVASTGSEGRVIATHGVTQVTGNVQLGTGGGEAFWGNGNWVISGAVTGFDFNTDRFFKTGNTIVTTIWLQNSENNFAQTLRIDSGTVRVADNGALGLNRGPRAIDLNGGALEIHTDNPNFETRNIFNRGTTGIIFVDRELGGSGLNQTVQFGNLNLDNATFTINGRNGYNVAINGATGAGTTTTWAGGANLTFNNNSSGTLTFDGGIAHNENTNARDFAVGGNGDTRITGSLLQLGTGVQRLVKNGTGMLTLSYDGAAPGTPFAGNTLITAGTLSFASPAALPAGQIQIGNATTSAGTLNYIGTGATLGRTILLNSTTANVNISANGSGALVIDGPILTTVNGAKALVLGGESTADNEISAVIGDSTSATNLQKIGSGRWILSGANTFNTVGTGATGISINSGTLAIKDTFTTGSRNVLVDTVPIAFAFDALSQSAGGALEYLGAAGSASEETVGVLGASAGMGTVRVVAGDGGTASLTINALGVILGGSAVNFVTNAGASIAVSDQMEFLGARAYFNGVNFAYADTGGVLRAPNYGVDPGFGAANAYELGSHTLVTGTGLTMEAGMAAMSSVKLLGTTALTLEAAQTLIVRTSPSAPGGILATGGAATITGGTGITTGGLGELVIRVDGSSDSLTLSTPIASNTTGGLGKNGAGLLVLEGDQFYVGPTTINEGTLRLGSGSRLGGATASNNNNLTVRQGGTLDINGNDIGVGAFNGSGSIASSGATTATFTIGNNNQNGVFTGTISGNLGLSKVGSGTTLSLTGINTYTGPTQLGGGLLVVNNLADIGVPSAIGAGDATSDASNAASLVFNNGGIQYTGANAQIFQNTQTPSVSTNRLFTLAGNGTIDSSGTFGHNALAATQNGAALVFRNNGDVAFSGAGARTLTLQGGSLGDNEIALRLIDNPNTGALSVTKNGTGLWMLTNTGNSYTGITLVQNGVLQIGDDSNALTRTLPTGSALVLGTTTTSGVVQTSGLFTRALAATATAGGVTFGGTTGGGGFSASTAKLTVNLGGNLVPDTLQWGAGGFVGTGGTQTLILSSSTAWADVEIQNTIDLNVATGTVQRTIQVDDNGNTGLDFATIAGAITNSGAATGTGGITKTGGGTLLFGNANTYNGNTVHSLGTLIVSSLGADGATASSLGTNVAGGSLVMGNGGNTVNLLYVGSGEVATRPLVFSGSTGTQQIDASGSGPLVLSNITNNATGGFVLQLRGSNTDFNMITSQLTNSGAQAMTVNKADGGVWVLNPSVTNSFTGAINVNSGTMGLTTDGIGAASLISISNGAVFGFGGPLVTDKLVNLANNSAAIWAGTNDITLNGNVQKVAGANDQTFSNNLENGAVLTVNGNFVNLQTAAGTRILNVRGYGSTVWNGIIQNNSATSLTRLDIRLADTASFTLNGENTFTGGLLLGQGTLIVGDPLGLGPAANNVILNGGVLTSTMPLIGADKILNKIQLQGDQVTVSGNQDIEFGGTVALDQNGNRFLRNELAPGNTLTISGTLNLSDSNTVRTLTIRGSGQTIITGVVANGGTGASSLAYSGLSNLELANAATATGNLILNRNMVTLNGAAGAWANGGVILNPTSTLTLDNSGTNNNNRLSNTANVTGQGGTLAIIGGAGGTTEAAGPLVLNSVQTHITMTGTGNTLSFPSVNFANTGSSLNLNGVENLGVDNKVLFTAATDATRFLGNLGILNGVMPRVFIGGEDFAAYDVTNGVVAFSNYNPTSTTNINAALAVDTVEVNAVMTTTGLTANRTINALKIDGDQIVVGSNGNKLLTLSAAALLNTGGDNTLNVSQVAFGATAYIQVQSGTTLEVNSILTGGAGLAKVLDGTLVLNTPSYITSTHNILKGTVVLNAGMNTFFQNQLLNINAGATLDLNGNVQYVGGLSDPGTLPETGGVITSNSGTGTLISNMAGGSATVATSIDGNVNFIRLGGNTLTFDSPQTYNGSTQMLGGTLTLQNEATLLNTSSIDLNTATLYLNNNGSLQRNIADRIGDSTPITMRDATFQYSGKVSDPSTEKIGVVTVAQGANVFNIFTGGTGTSGAFASADVTFERLDREAGTTISFSGSTAQGGIGNFPRIQFVEPLQTLSNGALGAWAIANSTDYAAYNSTNGIGTVGNGGYIGYDPTFGPGKITNIGTVADNFGAAPGTLTTTLAGNTTTSMLRLGGLFQNDLAFSNPGDVLNLEQGGLLRQSNVFGATIGTLTTPGVITAGGSETSGTREFIVYNNTFNPSYSGGTINVGTTTVTMSNTQGLLPGMTLTNANFPAGTTIVSINAYNQLTLSQASTNTATQTSQTFGTGSFVAGATTSGSPVVTMNSTTGIVPGMTITNAGLPTGTYVLSVDSDTQITVSQNAATTATNQSFSIPLGTMIVHSAIQDNGLGNEVQLIKSGGGVLNLSANNTYTGGTSVIQGTLNLIGSGVVVPAGGVLISNAALVMNTNSGQIDSSNVVTMRRSATLTLSGSNTLDSLIFENDGGTGTPIVNIGTGNTLTLTNSAPITVTSSNAAVIPTISAGFLHLGTGQKTISVQAPTTGEGAVYTNVTPGLNITSSITGVGVSIVKTDTGLLQVSGQSTFEGGLDVQAGGIILATNSISTVPNSLISGPLGVGAVHFAAGTTLMVDNGTRTVANAMSFDANPIFGNVSTGLPTMTLNGALNFSTLTTSGLVIDIPTPFLNVVLGGPIANIGSVTSIGSGTGANTITAIGRGNVTGLNLTGIGATVPIDIGGLTNNTVFSILHDGDGQETIETINIGPLTWDLATGTVPFLTVGRAGTANYYPTPAFKTIKPASLTSSTLASGLTVTANNGYGLELGQDATFNDGAVFTVNNPSNSNVPAQGLTLSGVISGASTGITKSGNGTLALTNSENDFGGAGAVINVTAGVLSVTNDGALGDPANIVQLSGNSTTQGFRATGTFSTGRTFNLNAANTAMEVSNQNTLTLTEPFAFGAATNALTKNDRGTLILSADNSTWNGNLTVTQGVIEVGHANALGSTVGRTIIGSLVGQIQVSGDLDIAEPIDIIGVNNNVFAGIDSTGFLRSTSGNNTWSGPISFTTATTADFQMRGGTITADAGSTLNLTGGISVALATGGASRDTWIGFGGDGTGNITTTGISHTGGVANSVFSIAKFGSGTWNFQASGYTGHAVFVNGGTLSLNGAGSFSAPGTGGSASLNTIAITRGGILELDNSLTNVNNRLGGTRNFDLRGGSLRISGNSGSATTETTTGIVTFNIGNATISLDADPAQPLTLTTGQITRNGGGTLLLEANPGATLQATGNGYIFIGQTGATGTTNKSIIPWAIGAIDSGSGTEVGFLTANSAAGGANSGSNPLRLLTLSEQSADSVVANGNVVLSTVTPTLSTNTTINSLVLGATAGITMNPSIVLNLDAGGVIAKSGNSGINGGILTTTSSRELIIHGLGDLEIASTIARTTGGLSKSGAGTLTLSAQNYYTGSTYVNEGTLKLSGGNDTLFYNNTLFAQGGVLDLNGNNQLVNTIQSSTATPRNANLIPDAGGTIINTGAGQATLATFTKNASFAGAIGNNVPAESNIALVSSQQAGFFFDWNLYTANTYSGPTIVNGGRIQLLGTGTLENTSSIELSHSTLLLSNNNATSILDKMVPGRINPTAPILLRGGMFQPRQRFGEISVDSFGAFTIAEGNSFLDVATAGTGINSYDVTLASLTQQVGSRGTVRFINIGAGWGSTSRVYLASAPTLENNIIGGWAVFDREFATYTDSTGIGGLTTQGYAGYSPATIHSAISTDNVRIGTIGTTTLESNRDINALAIVVSGNTTLDLGGQTLNLRSGGLIASWDPLESTCRHASLSIL